MSKFAIIPVDTEMTSDINWEENDDRFIIIEAIDAREAIKQYSNFEFEYRSRYEVKLSIMFEVKKLYEADELDSLEVEEKLLEEIECKIIKYHNANEDDYLPEQSILANYLYEVLPNDIAKQLFWDVCMEDYCAVELEEFDEYKDRTIRDIHNLIKDASDYDIITYNIFADIIRKGEKPIRIDYQTLTQHGMSDEEIGMYVNHFMNSLLKAVVFIEYDGGAFNVTRLYEDLSGVKNLQGNIEQFEMSIEPTKELISLAKINYDFRDGRTLEAIKAIETAR